MPECQNCKLREKCGTKVALELMQALKKDANKEAGFFNYCRSYDPEEKRGPGINPGPLLDGRHIYHSLWLR